VTSTRATRRRMAAQARTDQALAQVAQNRARAQSPAGKGEQANATLIPLAARLAMLTGEEFAGQEETAGRVMVSVAGKIAGLEAEMRRDGANPDLTLVMLVNVLAFAGEELARKETPR
jgi:hypothetical protein